VWADADKYAEELEAELELEQIEKAERQQQTKAKAAAGLVGSEAAAAGEGAE
jgi:hypothetical protein